MIDGIEGAPTWEAREAELKVRIEDLEEVYQVLGDLTGKPSWGMRE